MPNTPFPKFGTGSNHIGATDLKINSYLNQIKTGKENFLFDDISIVKNVN